MASTTIWNAVSETPDLLEEHDDFFTAPDMEREAMNNV